MNRQQEYQQAFDTMPIPVWKRTPLPDNLFADGVGTAEVALESSHPEITIEPLSVVDDNPAYSTYQTFLGREGTHQKSIGSKFSSYVVGYAREARLIASRARGLEIPKVKLSYKMPDSGENCLVEHLIVVESGCGLDVTIDISNESSQASRYFGRTTIVAKAGAIVRLTRVQRLSDTSETFDISLSIVEEGATVELVDLQLGSGYKAVSCESELVGRHARSVMKSAYYGEGEQKLDLSYTMTHGAQLTESIILAKGALADKATKVFRGNLFFQNGASGSVGKEEEFVTMLSPTVRSDSFPALMCSEDDVVGEHAASIGQIDPEKLFYLMSRGLSEPEAKRLLVKAAFEEILGGMNDEGLHALIVADLDRRLGG